MAMGDSNMMRVEADAEADRSSTVRTPPAKSKATAAATKPRRNLAMFLREWHQRAGLFAFLFMGWLGTSGVLINQSPSWGYDTHRIHWGWVMWLYGLHPEPPESGYAAGSHWLAVTPEGTVLDAKPLLPPVQQPLGVVAAGTAQEPLLFVANAEAVAVVTPDGARYDELRSPILPVSAIRRIGTVADEPGSIAVQDLDAFESLDGGNSWKRVDPARVRWSDAEPLPVPERERLLPFSRPYVTLEHVLVDAHSGAIFGRGGVYVINTVGIAAVWLAISGVWMWWRIKRRRQGTR